MTTTINNEHKELNFSSEREQSQACLNSAEYEKNQGRKVLNVPNLRFPEFQGEWEKCKLGDLCNVLMCKRILASQTNTEEGVPFYKIGTIGNAPDAYISKELFDDYKTKYNYPHKGEVMITCAGTVGKCVIYDGKDAYYQDSNIVWIDNPSQCISNSFLYHLLAKVDWRKLNSTTIIRIYNDDLRNLKLSYPQIEEQQKISRLLSLLDERIATQNKIIDKLQSLIKGISNKLLNSKKGMLVRLGAILKERSEKTKKNNQYAVLSSTVNGLFSQRDYFSKDIASENNVGYKIIRLHDVVLSPQNLWMGNINYNDKFDIGIVSPSYKVFLISDDYDKRYVTEILKTHRALYDYQLISEQGASVVRRNLNLESFGQLVFRIPPLDKQREIGKTISLLKSRLETESMLKATYQSQKQYLLRQMFI